MMGALEVQEALKIIHGLPVAAGSAMVFNGVANQFYTTRLPFRADCLSHETYPQPVELPLSATQPVADLFAAAQQTGLAGPLTLVLERDLVVSIGCPRCGWHIDVHRPRTRVSQAESIARPATSRPNRRL